MVGSWRNDYRNLHHNSPSLKSNDDLFPNPLEKDKTPLLELDSWRLESISTKCPQQIIANSKASAKNKVSLLFIVVQNNHANKFFACRGLKIHIIDPYVAIDRMWCHIHGLLNIQQTVAVFNLILHRSAYENSYNINNCKLLKALSKLNVIIFLFIH